MQTALVYLKGVGPERARLLKEELQLKTFQDLLHFSPTDTSIEAASTPSTIFPKTIQKFKSKDASHPFLMSLKNEVSEWSLALKMERVRWN